jgi:hypothetical protein
LVASPERPGFELPQASSRPCRSSSTALKALVARLHLIGAVFLDKTLTKCAEKNIKYKACNHFLGVFYFMYQG